MGIWRVLAARVSDEISTKLQIDLCCLSMYVIQEKNGLVSSIEVPLEVWSSYTLHLSSLMGKMESSAVGDRVVVI